MYGDEFFLDDYPDEYDESEDSYEDDEEPEPDETVLKNQKGFPRPVLPRNGRNTPMPWLGKEGPEQGDWALIKQDRALESEIQELCIVCGLPLAQKAEESDNPDDPDNFLFGLVFGKDHSDHVGVGFLGQIPTPTWMHPKCAQIAALYCPHLKGQNFPAMRQNGQKLTHEDLKEIAKKAHAPQES